MESVGFSVLAAYGSQLPIILAYLAGIVVSLVFWGRHPQAAKLACLGCLVLLLVVLVFTPISILLPHTILQGGGSARTVGPVMLGLGLVRSVLYVAGFGLLLVAAFAGRSSQARVG